MQSLNPSGAKSGKALLSVIALLLLGGGATAYYFNSDAPVTAAKPAAPSTTQTTPAPTATSQAGQAVHTDRQAAYSAAVAKIEADPNWPATPEEVIRQYWDAASRKDFERMTIFCPGTSVAELKSYYGQWTTSPVKTIGPAEHDAKDPNLNFYRVKGIYPTFPEKTVKMALRPAPGGKLVIDGAKTIWW